MFERSGLEMWQRKKQTPIRLHQKGTHCYTTKLLRMAVRQANTRNFELGEITPKSEKVFSPSLQTNGKGHKLHGSD